MNRRVHPRAARDADPSPPRAIQRGLSPAADGGLLGRTPSGKPMNTLELVERLCSASPSLVEARRVHVQHFGTLIPHIFMAAVLVRVGQCLLAGSPDAQGRHRAELEGILAALELGMATGERETRNVIAISFVRDGEVELFFDELKKWLGPKTLGQVRGR